MISEMEYMLDENVEYWVQGIGTFGKSEISDIMRGIIGKCQHASTEVLDLIETENKVAVTMKTTFRLKSGADVVDDLCLVAEVSDGRLVKVREYLDQRVIPHFMG